MPERAFPLPGVKADEDEAGRAPGMDLRDWFAGQALPALAATAVYERDSDTPRPERLAASAYRIADAMMTAREESRRLG